MSFLGKMVRLATVHPPFINSMSKDFKDEANSTFAAKLKRSKLYMIGARPRTEFGDVQIIDTVNDIARVEIKLAGETVDWGLINLQANVPLGGAVHAAWDDQIIQIGHNRPAPGEKMHSHTWYTPDSVYWEISRGNPNLQGFDNHATVCNYDLLYVGIANKQDSFERLLKKAHQGRVEILTEEKIRYPTPSNRVSDEIVLFFFDIDPLLIQQWSPEDEMDDIILDINSPRTIADAEKAFVSLLKPEYNNIQFKEYPRGQDGLYGSGFNIYQYVIFENFTFNTPSGSFIGSRNEFGLGSSGHTIVVEGDNVRLYPPE
jgi:hypothetical protein